MKLPKAIEEASQDNLRIADEVAAMGYMPYYGPTVAGFAPQQLSAMAGVDKAAKYFGMPSATGNMPTNMDSGRFLQALTGMRSPNARAGAFEGYSAAPIYQAGIRQIAPAQRAAIQSFVMDPVTGAPPTNLSIPAPATQFRINPAQGRTPAEAKRLAKYNRNNKIQERKTAADRRREEYEARKAKYLSFRNQFQGK